MFFLIIRTWLLIYWNNVLHHFTGGNTCLHRQRACPNRSWRICRHVLNRRCLIVSWFARREHTIAAVGFALLVLAEGIILSGLFLLASAPTFPGAYTFAAGVALYAVALPLISVPPAFPLWTRIVGVLAAIPFAAHGLLWLLGHSPASSGPLASIGYVLLIVTIIGWMITVLRAAPSPQR